jgi:hypothetical protein
MTEEEISEFFARWAGQRHEVREAWLAEIQKSGQAAEWKDVLDLLASQDEDLAQRMVGIGEWWSEAPRRNASKKRPRQSWQRELAAHFRREDTAGTMTRLAKFRSLPREHYDEDPLQLCDGKWEIQRDKDDRIVCTEHATGQHDDISFATFERYLKEKPKTE